MRLHVANKHLPSDWPGKSLVAEVLEQMRNVIDEGRNVLRGLRLTSGSSASLEQAFSEVGFELGEQRPVEYRVLVQGTPIPLRPAIRDELYLIGREALANAFHHSQARAIEVELQYQRHHLRIFIRDNGRGIDPQILRSGRDGHWGLCGMRERAERMGGNLRVFSGAVGGTEIEFLVPGQVAFRAGPGRRSRWVSRLYLRKNEASQSQAGGQRSE
jgi:signal transduction histidine kinase